MMLPKPQRRKKRKKHKASILHCKDGTCYLCLEHHIWGPGAVHNNQENMRILQQDGQRAYERTHTREEFMELIGRNYLDAEYEEFIVPIESKEPGIVFLEPDCQGCFGAADNQCERCREERHD